MAGQVGVVTGFSTPEYIAVTVNEDGYMIAAVDLEFTGERVDPEFFQTGDHIAVRPQYYGPESDSEATE